MALPVARRAEEVVERIAESGTVVVVGETGSGKTTQLGQALLDANAAGDGAVAVTQPRRVATVSVANRVARERGQEIGGEVGYTVRFEDRTSEHTRMRFLTDGALLRELLRDPWLRAFGAIVLDEAHERSLNTDILFALCKKLSSERSPPLRLLVTSATLDGSKFSAFFSNAPIVSIPGRAFDIDIAYTTQTPTSYIDAALDATLQVHCSHPVPGDILVFMPGQDDIDRLVRKLNDAVASMDEADCPDAQVLPLHAALPPEMQARVFSDPPTNVRRIVVSTNIAETSVTVPGIVHVVDPGKVKRKEYDPSTGMESLAVEDISRTEAIQRAGRAGRTQPGKCYRLYTKELFENRMKSTAKPEIQRSSLAATVLHLKALSLGIDVLSFDFLDPPPREALEDALRQLYIVDAIDIDGNATELGREMSNLPLDPPLSRALLAAVSFGCVSEMCSVAGMLSAERIFHSATANAAARRRDRRADDEKATAHFDRDWSAICSGKEIGYGDYVLLLRLCQAYEASHNRKALSYEYNLSAKGMDYALSVKEQLQNMCDMLSSASEDGTKHSTGKKEGEHRKKRKRRGDSNGKDEVSDETKFGSTMHAMRAAVCIGYAGKLAKRMPNHNGYRTYNDSSVLVGVHPSSERLLNIEEGLFPEWLVYHELITTSRPYMRNVCAVEDSWVRPLIPKLKSVDVQRLSGVRRNGHQEEDGPIEREDSSKAASAMQRSSDFGLSEQPRDGGKNERELMNARERYFQRRAQKKSRAGSIR